MVNIKIYRNQCRQVSKFYADGHSNADEFGFDIVCAAISAVMQTALYGLGEYLDLENRMTYSIDEDGWLYCELPHDLSVEERNMVDVIIETMIIGLKNIEKEYIDCILVEEEVE
ncbi:MAG: ribosomal-processing cysteine protease Prp [Halanaerobiales bacterium]|nr:ribosomal-processing cysteine protease Prp [Halanaerobiales bacterium]